MGLLIETPRFTLSFLEWRRNYSGLTHTYLYYMSYLSYFVIWHTGPLNVCLREALQTLMNWEEISRYAFFYEYYENNSFFLCKVTWLYYLRVSTRQSYNIHRTRHDSTTQKWSLHQLIGICCCCFIHASSSLAHSLAADCSISNYIFTDSHYTLTPMASSSCCDISG